MRHGCLIERVIVARISTISAALREVQMETKEHPDNRHTATIYPTTAALGTPKTARTLTRKESKYGGLMKVTLSAETMTISAALREVQMETKEHPDNRHTATIYPTTAALGTPKTARTLTRKESKYGGLMKVTLSAETMTISAAPRNLHPRFLLPRHQAIPADPKSYKKRKTLSYASRLRIK